MNRLEAEGLVTLRPRCGYTVTALDQDEISEIFQLHMVIEEHAGYVATLARTQADVDDTEKILDSMEVRDGYGMSARHIVAACQSLVR